MSAPKRSPLKAADVAAFHQTLSNWHRWGERDQLGTLNLVTPEKRAAAAALVRSGRAVSCARPIATEPGPSNPQPAAHHMIGTHSEGWGGDYFALASHGYATTHLDALCHIFHEGRLYNGYSTDRVTAHGALELSVDALRHGIVTRGVLLDVPAAKEKPWLEPGEPIHPEDLEQAERAAAIQVESGDVLLVRTGRFARVATHGDWNPRERLAGLHADCLPWLHARGVAALGSDGVSDVHPSGIDDVRLPIHTVGIVAMGLSLLDNLDLEALALACHEERRSVFLFTAAPLVLLRGTASPVNPIALF
ncbi:MAG TPA: cyclase family protein [Myxococcota bacterium]|nr:cyclase family protein [Myxococcota bacterium]